MNENKLAKREKVAEITQKISTAKSIVVAEYAGLSVKQLQDLRQLFSEQGVEAKVYKNRLFKIAANNSGLEKITSFLTGPNLYVFGLESDIAPAKIVANYAKTHQVLKMKAGTFEGSVIGVEELAKIAALPTWEEALTKLAMSLLGPIQQISVGLNILAKEEILKTN